jgi:hypothetical protein
VPVIIFNICTIYVQVSGDDSDQGDEIRGWDPCPQVRPAVLDPAFKCDRSRFNVCTLVVLVPVPVLNNK